MVGKGKNFAIQIAGSNSSQSSKSKITLEQIHAKRNIQTNQALVNADAAENIVLSLLEVCADTTEQFTALAQGDDAVVVSKNGEQGEDVTSSDVIPPTSTSSTSSSNGNSNDNDNSNGNGGEEDRTIRIKKNGKLIQAKLKKIHDLLAPHAHLVVNYSNEQSAPKDKDLDEKDHEIVNKDEDEGEHEGEGEGEGEADQETKKEEDETKEDQNMYSSRMEMRLAIERRNLLRDLLKLEKLRRNHNDINAVSANSSDDANSQKRKREE